MARVRARSGTRRGSPAQGQARQSHVEEPRQAHGSPGRGQRRSRRVVGPCHRPQEPPRTGCRTSDQAAGDHPAVGRLASHGRAWARDFIQRGCGIWRRRTVGGGAEACHGQEGDPETSRIGRFETPSSVRLEASSDDRAEDDACRLKALDDPDAQTATLIRSSARKRRARNSADRADGLTSTADR
jgi:hypothetical protein